MNLIALFLISMFFGSVNLARAEVNGFEGNLWGADQVKVLKAFPRAVKVLTPVTFVETWVTTYRFAGRGIAEVQLLFLNQKFRGVVVYFPWARHAEMLDYLKALKVDPNESDGERDWWNGTNTAVGMIIKPLVFKTREMGQMMIMTKILLETERKEPKE